MTKEMKMELRRNVLLLALEIAADQYDKDAKRGSRDGSNVLSEQFKRQAQEAREAGADIEDADVIYLKD